MSTNESSNKPAYQFTFEEMFEYRLLAFSVRDIEFYHRIAAPIMRYDFFSTTFSRDVYEQAEKYMKKYGKAIPKDILKNEIQKMFEETHKKDIEIKDYFDSIDYIFNLDLTDGEQYAEEEVLNFVRRQNMKKVLNDGWDVIDSRGPLESIVEAATKAANIGKAASKVWETLPTVSSLEESTTTDWLVDGIIPNKAITIFHGKGGIGKSTLMWCLGNSVAEGKPFLNRFPVKQCPVYYIDVQFITDGSEELEEILKSPILVPLDSGGRDYIWPKDDPEQFMRKLGFNYRGSYFKCGPAEEY